MSQELTDYEVHRLIADYNEKWKHCYHWYKIRNLPVPDECLPHNRFQSCRGCCPVWHKPGDLGELDSV